jgi:DNA topoisomerase VI subunit B
LIVSNLLSNAFKFTPEGGKISVQLTVNSNQLTANQLFTDHCLLITVKDTGIGIPPDKLEKIFDRFYQADDSYAREQEGSGIGLALTKELVELHHGEIHVASEVGKGSTFIVRLPLGREHLKPEEIVEEVASDQFSFISESASVNLQVASKVLIPHQSNHPSIHQSRLKQPATGHFFSSSKTTQTCALISAIISTKTIKSSRRSTAKKDLKNRRERFLT